MMNMMKLAFLQIHHQTLSSLWLLVSNEKFLPQK
jgi:hypothetical protein